MEPPRIASLGKYRIESTLGVGAMGVVYKAFDPHIERHVALKTIRSELFETTERSSLMTRFRNEAQAAGRLTHANIVAVYDYGEADGTAYLAMEYVCGRPLSVVLEDCKPLDTRTALDGFAQVLAALGYAHQRGIVHRDIKPANLLTTDLQTNDLLTHAQAQIKVTDFGIAHIESSTLTVVGSIVGTPSYMAPEQFTGDGIDGRSDLYSAAVVLYQMLTGERPFNGTPASVIQQMLRDTPRAPTQINPALPPAIDAVLLRALAKDRDARYPTAADLGRAVSVAFGVRADNGVDDDRTVLLSRVSAKPESTWAAADLAAVEARLAAQIGPVARLLIARAAAQATDLPSLGSLLVSHIPSDKGRKQFSASLATLTDFASRSMSDEVANVEAKDAKVATSPNAGANAGRDDDTTITPDRIRAAAQRLAVYIGPIAQILAKREAARAVDMRALLDTLASAINNEQDRARFRSEVGLAAQNLRRTQ